MKVALKPMMMKQAATIPHPSLYIRPNIFGNQ